MTVATVAVSHSGQRSVSASRNNATITTKVGAENSSSRRNGGPSRIAPPSFGRKNVYAMATTTRVKAAKTKNGIRQASPPMPSEVPQLISSGVKMMPTVRPIDRPAITTPSPRVRCATGVLFMISVRSLE